MNYLSVVVWGVDDPRPEEVCDKPLKLLQEFKQSYPEVKITLFVTPDWVHKPQNKMLKFDFLGILKHFVKYNSWPGGTYSLDKHKNWVNNLKEFEVADHGLTHFQQARASAAEFERLSYEQCANKIQRALELFETVGVKPKGFAPPGWGVNDNLVKALKDFKFRYLAGCLDDTVEVGKDAVANQAGIKNVKAFFPTDLGGIVNIPRNWDIHKSSLERAENVIKLNGILGLHSHILDEYLGERIGNGITENNLKNVEKLLDSIENNSLDVEFKNFAEVTDNFYSDLAKNKPANLA